MSKHKERGLIGEQIAENFLLAKGYSILFKNWRSGKKEIDIIASYSDTIIFVEVKTRTSFDFGTPEEAVNYKKVANMRFAAEAFLIDNPDVQKLQFDVISILLKEGNEYVLTHFENAF